MKIKKFEDLEVWKESMNLSILIYRALIKWLPVTGHGLPVTGNDECKSENYEN
ncbi:MAG: hypothetical protein K8R63_02785 [Bacteroidales bacterium]|nr:hypothetical protein [Bacteroidales bacterium]